MKIVLIGANGKIGELVQKALAGAGHEIVKVGHKSGDFRVEIENRESVRKLYHAVGSFDATILKESEAHMGSFFPGVIPVEGWKVGQAYERAILGAQTGSVYKVD